MIDSDIKENDVAGFDKCDELSCVRFVIGGNTD